MSHSHLHAEPAPASRAVRLGLAIVMALLGLITIVGMVLLWPDYSLLPEKLPVLAEGASYHDATVVAIEDGIVVAEIAPDGEIKAIHVDPDIPLDHFRVGMKVKLLHLPNTVGLDSGYVFQDFRRGPQLWLLLAIFIVVVLAVARLKGLAALGGLVIALVIVGVFLLPALLSGRSPLGVALVASSAIMFVVVYLAHGISVKTTTALLGTFAGVGVVTALAWWMIPSAGLIPSSHEGMYLFFQLTPGLNLRGVLLCGMVLAGVGVLNDVTITQASAVWELAAAAPDLPRRRLFSHGMKIGRDHIASTVYTIAFAYIGTALGILLLATLYDHSLADILTFEEVAEEIVRTLVASIGLVLSIPLTTAIAAALAPGQRGPAVGTTGGTGAVTTA